MTNYPANLADVYVGRSWDPENTFAAPWQGGMTGLMFDRSITGDLTSLEAFWDPQFAGRMTFLTEMRDTVGLAALHLGLDPETLTQEQFDQAVAEVVRASEEGLVRQFTGNSYYNVMLRGDAVLAMGWSGDVEGLLIPDQTGDQDFAWALPEEGGMIWTDNMGIPKGAQNKVSAEYWIDFYYDPEIAAIVEAWVNYVCPVKGAREEMIKLDPSLAESPLIFPTDEMSARLYDFVSLDIDTAQQWEEAFADAIGL
jgi:spermidine/putrescine transport system substrate-binding protein